MVGVTVRSWLSSASIIATGTLPLLLVNRTVVALTVNRLTGSLSRTTTGLLTGTSTLPSGGLSATTNGGVRSPIPSPVAKRSRKYPLSLLLPAVSVTP